MSAEILRDLALVKAVFQLRTIVAVIHGACDSGSRAERQDREDGLGPQGRQSGPEGIAQP